MKNDGGFGWILRGALAAGVLATTLTATVAQADQGPGRGQGNGKGSTIAAERGKPEMPGSASLKGRHAAGGTIRSLDAAKQSFVLTTKHGDLTVATDINTEFKARGEETVTFAKLVKDQRVTVQGSRPNETTLLAKRVIVRSAKDEPAKADKDAKGEAAGRTAITGVISEYVAGKSFKVTPSGGAAVPLTITDKTKTTQKGTAMFGNGQTARVVSTKDASGANVALKIRVPAGSS